MKDVPIEAVTVGSGHGVINIFTNFSFSHAIQRLFSMLNVYLSASYKVIQSYETEPANKFICAHCVCSVRSLCHLVCSVYLRKLTARTFRPNSICHGSWYLMLIAEAISAD